MSDYIIIVLALAFLPVLVAAKRRHCNTLAIGMLNVLTFLGASILYAFASQLGALVFIIGVVAWIVALVWACTSDVRPAPYREPLLSRRGAGIVAVLLVGALMAMAAVASYTSYRSRPPPLSDAEFARWQQQQQEEIARRNVSTQEGKGDSENHSQIEGIKKRAVPDRRPSVERGAERRAPR